jgi:hypothetical protein
MERSLFVVDALHQGLDLVGDEVIDLDRDPPAAGASTSPAVSSIVSGRFISERSVPLVRPVQYTVAPRAPSSTAIPRPAARDAPATRATLPSKDASMPA